MVCTHSLSLLIILLLNFACAVRKRTRKPSFEESSYSEISSSSSDSAELSGAKDIHRSSPTVGTNRRIESEEESEDDSDIYEQFRVGRKLSVNSVYSNEESSSEEEQQGEDVIKKSLSPLPAVHTDHEYAKPVIASESEEVSVNEEEDEAELLKKREEMLTAQARQHSFPKRTSEEEEQNLRTYLEDCGPDQEEVKMFKLALKRMKEANNDLVSDVPWAFYPSDILYCVVYMCVHGCIGV